MSDQKQQVKSVEEEVNCSKRIGFGQVYAIEGSPEIAKVASRLSRSNGFAGTLEVIPKHLEQVTEEDTTV